MAKPTENIPNSVNLIGAGTTIKGDLESNGDIRIDGTLLGNAQINGKLILGRNAYIKGNLFCQNIDIEGKIEGDIIIENLATLRATANVIGNLTTDRLAIEVGAIFSGICRMANNNSDEPTTNKS